MVMPNNSMESDQDTGTGTQPGSPASTSGASQPSAADVEALKRLLQPFIEETAAKAAQSTKDKRFSKQEQRLDDFESRLTQYDELISGGLNQKQALQFMKLEQLLDKAGASEGTGVQSGVQVGSQAPAASVDEQAVLRKLGLSESDPEVSRVLREQPDPVQRIVAFAEMVKTRTQAPTAPANPAQVMPSAGGAPAGLSTDKLMAEYREMTKTLPQGEKGVDGRFAAKVAIRKKAAELGIESPV